MKTCILFLLFCITGFYSSAQEFACHFKVVHIETYPAAKPLISILRQQYNTEADPKRVQVVFTAGEKTFDIVSTVRIGQSDIEALLHDYSYELLDFTEVEKQAK